MDPTANLKEQDQLLSTPYHLRTRADKDRLRELRAALTTWIANGGFAPPWHQYPRASQYYFAALRTRGIPPAEQAKLRQQGETTLAYTPPRRLVWMLYTYADGQSMIQCFGTEDARRAAVIDHACGRGFMPDVDTTDAQDYEDACAWLDDHGHDYDLDEGEI